MRKETKEKKETLKLIKSHQILDMKNMMIMRKKITNNIKPIQNMGNHLTLIILAIKKVMIKEIMKKRQDQAITITRMKVNKVFHIQARKKV